jgi:Leucine-rich repeat (LRR) protein
MRWQVFGCLLGAVLIVPIAFAAEPSEQSLQEVIRLHGGAVVQDSETKLSDVKLFGTAATDTEFAKVQPIAVRRLDISRSHLSGATVRRIANQKELQQLAASDTDFADTDLSFLADASQLKRLWLERTKVTSAGLVGIAQFPTLETLFLDGKFSDAAIGHVVNLAQPAHLRVISDDSTGEFLGLPGAKERLTRLKFTGTPIGNQGLARLHDARRLNKLYLSYSKVDDLGLESLQQLPRLETLLLTDNQIEGRGLANFKHLKCLIVDENLRADQLTGLSTLPALEHLGVIDAAGCGTAVVKQLSALKSLRKLELWNTQLDSKGGERLAELEGLETLVLYRETISRPLLRSISKMRSLQSLTLERCALASGVFWELASRTDGIDLDLTGSNVTDGDLDHLLSLTLSSLRIKETNLSDTTRKKLRARFGTGLKET